MRMLPAERVLATMPDVQMAELEHAERLAAAVELRELLIAVLEEQGATAPELPSGFAAVEITPEPAPAPSDIDL